MVFVLLVLVVVDGAVDVVVAVANEVVVDVVVCSC